ncbi:AraC family transcriptional regulator [Ramlibacter sp. WS9]|uniref:AraC family transcriptional regulator n=1 Tax=Ramlibacter sp. WS9 TaxID=1882741 RepID=UPI0013051114|nr:AraC family transcriptional regulator [Ramlibacter sp. WS9]
MVSANDPTMAPAQRWRSQFHTSCADEAVETVERLYGPHSLALRTRTGLDMRLAGFDVGRLTVSSIEYGCVATARTEEPHDYWVFSYAARGEIVLGKDIVRAGTAGVRTPDAAGDLPMSADLRLMNLKVTQADLMGAARTLFGELPAAPLGFMELAAPGSAPALHLQGLMQRLNQLPVCPGPQAALIERRWQEAALLELFLLWPHTWSRYLGSEAPRGSAVERAIDYIQANAGADVTLADVAAAAGVGARALTSGFEKKLGISPMRYLQQCRLERARADLLDARASVTEIAYRWGFGNLGDFAARYRERFGEKPSETLRR